MIQSIFTVILSLSTLGLTAQYIEIGPYSGGVTASTAVVVYKISLPDQVCRVEYSKASSMNHSEFSDSFISEPAKANYVKIALSNLDPDTEYFYRLELNGNIKERSSGNFRTFADARKSFKIGFGSCLRAESKRSGLRAAIDKDISFFLNTGDLHYDNNQVADLGVFLNSFHKALTRKDLSYMGKRVPFVYMWDDHDYGPNNSDSTAPGRLESGEAYRGCIPHYPLPTKELNGAIYQAFTVNDARLILTDLRSKRDPNDKSDDEKKTMMGAEQLAWFLRELKESSLTHSLLIWVSSVPYTAKKKKGADHWGGFTHERQVIANFVKEHRINNLMIISGDAHSVLYNSGVDNNYSDVEGDGLFEVIASPLDNWAKSVKGGPWTGKYIPDDHQQVYGLLEVDYFSENTVVGFKALDTNDEVVLQAEKLFDRRHAPFGDE